MRIIDRYLVRGFIGPFLYCLAMFLVLFVVVDCFEKLDEYLKHSAGMPVVLSYYFYLMPQLFIQIVPVAALAALLFKLSHLNRHHELVALKASGMSSFQILTPFFFSGILISLWMLLINEVILPRSSLTSASVMEGLILRGKKGSWERAIKNVTLYSQDKRTLFAREYEIPTQTLYDVVIIKDGENQAPQSKLTAKKAKFESDRWIFTDVMRYELNRRGDIAGDPAFSQKLEIEMAERPEDFLKSAAQTEFMSTKQLKDHIQRLEGASPSLVRRLWVDWHHKIAFSFVSFVVMLVGAPLAMRAERGSEWVGVGTALLVAISYYGVNSVFLSFGKGGTLSPFLAAWLSNVLFAAGGIYLIKNTP